MQPRPRESPIATYRTFRDAKSQRGFGFVISGEIATLDDLGKTQRFACQTAKCVIQGEQRGIVLDTDLECPSNRYMRRTLAALASQPRDSMIYKRVPQANAAARMKCALSFQP